MARTSPRTRRALLKGLLRLTNIIFRGGAATRNHTFLLALTFCLLCACTGTRSDDSRSDPNAPAIGEAQLPLLGQTLWSRSFGGGSQQDLAYARSVAVDPGGNSLITGELYGTVFFNGTCGALSSGPANANAYVAKFAPDGTCRWAQAYGDLVNDQLGEGVAVDSNGNVFVVGSFRGTMDFGCGPLQSAAASNIFLAKLSPDGVCRWSQEFGDGNSHHGHAVAVDNNGSNSTVVITGKSLGYVDFGGGWIGRVGGEPGYNTYVAKFLDLDGPNDGLYQMANVYGTTGDAIGRGIAVDNQHRIVVTGYFTGSTNFGTLPGTALLSAGQEDIFIAKLNPDLSHQWSSRYGDSEPQYAISVATDSSQNIVFTGGFYGNITFNGIIDPLLSGRSGISIFLISLYANGLPRWAKQFGDEGDMSGAAVATGPGNSVLLTGPFRGVVTFPSVTGNITLRSMPGLGREDVFLAKFASDLRNFDAKQFGNPQDTYSESVCLDTAGNVLVAGSFTGTMTFDSQSVNSHGNTDIFIAKLAHRCDGANCDGCCDGNNTCHSPTSVPFCGSYGSTCFACDPNTADSCQAGQCRCGGGPACTVTGSTCSGSQCHCPQCGTYPNCVACTCPECGVWPNCVACTCPECGVWPNCVSCTCYPDCGTYPYCHSCTTCGPGCWECCPGQCCCSPDEHCF